MKFDRTYKQECNCCGRLYRGPSIYCSLKCSITDWSALGACPVLGKADETADMAKTTLLTDSVEKGS
jgi:hypothetical protein